MLRTVLILFLFAVLASCSNTPIPPPPTEPCDCVEMSTYPVITNGFIGSEFDTVTIQRYYKNSKFDSLLEEYKVAIDVMSSREEDVSRARRTMDFPRGITSCNDYVFIFADSTRFAVDSIQPMWVKRYCNEFCGYDCTIVSYRMADSTYYDANIGLQHPEYKFPWE